MIGRGRSDDLGDPALYGYPQYCADMTALIARIDAPQIDWVGTSMGGLIGLMLAAQPNTPIRRLVINDIGPWIPLAAIQRIGTYVSKPFVCATLAEMERHVRAVYAPFGITDDADWAEFTRHSTRTLPDGKLTQAYDPGIAQNFCSVTEDVDLWSLYDRVRCPVLLLRGAESDVLPADVAEAMTRRGPRAQLVEIPRVGHAPALLDSQQRELIRRFLDAEA